MGIILAQIFTREKKTSYLAKTYVEIYILSGNSWHCKS